MGDVANRVAKFLPEEHENERWPEIRADILDSISRLEAGYEEMKQGQDTTAHIATIRHLEARIAAVTKLIEPIAAWAAGDAVGTEQGG